MVVGREWSYVGNGRRSGVVVRRESSLVGYRCSSGLFISRHSSSVGSFRTPDLVVRLLLFVLHSVRL